MGVDGADSVVAEEGVGPACQREVGAQVPVGLGGGQGGGWDVLAALDQRIQLRYEFSLGSSPGAR